MANKARHIVNKSSFGNCQGPGHGLLFCPRRPFKLTVWHTSIEILGWETEARHKTGVPFHYSWSQNLISCSSCDSKRCWKLIEIHFVPEVFCVLTIREGSLVRKWKKMYLLRSLNGNLGACKYSQGLRPLLLNNFQAALW